MIKRLTVLILSLLLICTFNSAPSRAISSESVVQPIDAKITMNQQQAVNVEETTQIQSEVKENGENPTTNEINTEESEKSNAPSHTASPINGDLRSAFEELNTENPTTDTNTTTVDSSQVNNDGMETTKNTPTDSTEENSKTDSETTPQGAIPEADSTVKNPEMNTAPESGVTISEEVIEQTVLDKKPENGTELNSPVNSSQEKQVNTDQITEQPKTQDVTNTTSPDSAQTDDSRVNTETNPADESIQVTGSQDVINLDSSKQPTEKDEIISNTPEVNAEDVNLEQNTDKKTSTEVNQGSTAGQATEEQKSEPPTTVTEKATPSTVVKDNTLKKATQDDHLKNKPQPQKVEADSGKAINSLETSREQWAKKDSTIAKVIFLFKEFSNWLNTLVGKVV